MRLILTVCVLGFLFGCSPKPGGSKANDGKHFGNKIDAKNAMTYDALLAAMAGKTEMDGVKVKGKIETVCQVKGCWMTMVSEKPNQAPIFVKFKDYGFFVPKDLSGKNVVMEGKAFYETTSVEELKHYAEDEGLSKEKIDAITQPKEELKFLSTGVLVLN